MGVVRRLWVKRFKGGPMDEVSAVRMDPESGIEANASTGRKRQVTVVSVESFRDVSAELGREVDPVLRRANVLVEGIELADSRGKLLRLGDVSIRIWGETRPCRRMEESMEGLQAALDPAWRAGAHGEVVEEGRVERGDVVELVEVPG